MRSLFHAVRKTYLFLCVALPLLFALGGITACDEEFDHPLPGEGFEPYNLLVRPFTQVVYIRLNGHSAEIYGPAANLVDYTISTQKLSGHGIAETDSTTSAVTHIQIKSEQQGIAYFVYGSIVPTIDKATSMDCQYYGNITLDSSSDYALYLNNARLQSHQGPAFESRGEGDCYMVLCNGSKNAFSDSEDYTDHIDSPACVCVSGDLYFDGLGSLSIRSKGIISANDSLYTHALQASGVTCAYDIKAQFSALGDALHLTDSDATIKRGTWELTAGRNALYSSAGNIYLDGGILSGVAQHGSFVSTQGDYGFAVDSALCFGASALPSEVGNISPQIIRQQYVDSIVLRPDTMVSAYVGNNKVASLTPRCRLAAPCLLLSSPGLTESDSISFR